MRRLLPFCLVIAAWMAAGTPRIASAAPTLNGWDTDNIYVLRTHIYSFGSPEVPPNSIQIVTEANLIPDKPLTRFGSLLVYDDSDPKTITFSNSPLAGAHSPAGARFFLAEAAPGNARKVDIQIFEYDSAGNPLRRSSLGATFGVGPGQLVSSAQSGNSVIIGGIRYNPKKNTLAVSATLETNNGGTVRCKVFEFALPDWIANGAASDVPVTAVQVYEAPPGHTTFGDPLNIDFDDNGNMYMTGKTFNGNTTGDNFKSDLIKINTMGLNGGLSTFVVPITGASSGNLLIEGGIENQTVDYDSIYSLAVRTTHHSIVLLTRTTDGPGEPMLEYDLNQRTGNGNLLLIQNWYSYPNEFGLNSEPNAAQRDPDNGAVLVSCGRGEPGGGPKRINTSGSIEVIGYRNWDAASPPPIPLVPFSADADGDGDVDQADFGGFQACFGTVATPATFGCRHFDVNQDINISTTDFSAFLSCLSGPDHPKAPGC